MEHELWAFNPLVGPAVAAVYFLGVVGLALADRAMRRWKDRDYPERGLDRDGEVH